ncbi:protein SENSITIVITY TO RED LIGHT REDUCED 1-like [Raphanus sativus]|uniref:Protein SENSITIVITY TO RED LIGHT REDUCED 1-like n=1 Tax=Raphanus sativus TaxID=3726 RepID=A0A9W3BY36_RAPSA|nr:protein SENSITIVITY TO RED LIGHT REDUCED 1-like [Raphanus sativus]
MKKEAAKESKPEKIAKMKQVEEDISKHSDGKWTEEKGHARKKQKLTGQDKEGHDLEIDHHREDRLKKQMEISTKKSESSEFYKSKQLKFSDVSGHFRLMLGSETQLQMMIYGLGSIESDENSRFQLSIAILMKREFDWVNNQHTSVNNNIEVFDPVLSATESSVMTSFGCTVLSVNEEARREALKPTLFFMPHCRPNLYGNLLESNWRMDRLSKIALLGNSFEMYKDKVFNNQNLIQSIKRIKAAQRITTEFAINTGSEDVYDCAFHILSWHFFRTGVDCELPSLQ